MLFFFYHINFIFIRFLFNQNLNKTTNNKSDEVKCLENGVGYPLVHVQHKIKPKEKKTKVHTIIFKTKAH